MTLDALPELSRSTNSLRGDQGTSGDDATLILKGCRLLNVYSGMTSETDITIAGERIVSIDKRETYDGLPVVDCHGLYAMPGMIDAHMHVDTTFLWPGELARVLLPLGTTTVVVDTTNNAHTGGVEAVDVLRRSFEGLPMRGYVAAPSYCPFDAALGTAAVEMKSRDIAELLGDGCMSIGETVWSRIALEDFDYMRVIQTCREAGYRVSGHGGEIRRGDEPAFDGYVASGIQDDHCIARGEDILPRLRRGLKLFFVECTGRRGQLRPLLDEMLRKGLSFRQVCMCIDNNTSIDIVTKNYGYLDYLVRTALDAGVSALDTYRMVTLNPAEHFRLSDQIGSIAPGRLADILLTKAPDVFPPEYVFVGGKVVARRGELLVDIPKPSFPETYRNSVKLAKVQRASLKCDAPRDATSVQARVFEVVDGDSFNRGFVHQLEVTADGIQPDPRNDILKIVVVERYGRHGNVGVGFVKGFGLRRGALATSISVPFNNVVVVGATDDDIWHAIQRMGEIQGGFIAVADGKVLAEASLRVGGIMSEEPYETLLASIDRAQQAAAELGCTLTDPFKTLVSTIHTTLPDLGLTDKGLINSRIGVGTTVVVEGGHHAGN
ncbi:adenine deaminase C-terminal domain-containing protein [Ensifer sp. NPDC090286]|uniref:adenine deaminase C-terminal domain-containing protein n=1 Tax=Ensifer sp. NPDC090286 TaxID=3363991 RepID=UPI003839D5B6